jgi:hypothetical protein
MSTVRDLHDQAMHLAQDALLARQAGDVTQAENLARQALPLELQAAARVAKEPASEPTRSILYLSAASLAYQCNDFATAQRLVAEGLSGYPPPRVEQELKDFYDQINFASHLQVRDVDLAADDVQLALAGKAVGSGLVLYNAFLNRAQTMVALLDRTMRRLMGQPYQQSGPPKEVFRPFTPLIATPRTGSFAVTFQLAPKLNQSRPLGVTGGQVIEEVMTGIELIQEERLLDLRARFEDERYYRNFLAGAKGLAPDGERINFVGLTSSRRAVSFTRPTSEIVIPVSSPATMDTPDHLSERIRLRGVLDFANARGNDQVGLTTDDEQRHDLRVEEGLEDVVRSYFGRAVEILGRREGSRIVLEDIQGVED